MMEPQEILIRTSTDVIVKAAERIGILGCSIATRMTAIETYPLFVCFMIVRRHPVGACTGHVAPRFRAVMVSPCKEVMQPEWHHIVYHGLAAFHHHLL